MNIKIFEKLFGFRNNIKKRPLIIRIDTNNYKLGMKKAKILIDSLERKMRIHKLEIAVKNMNISRTY